MVRGLLLLILLLLVSPALADEPLLSPAVWQTCSPNGKHCVSLDPHTNTVTAYGAGKTEGPLWMAPGWSRVAALSDDGEHLMMGYAGMNLIPVDYDSEMPMLTFFRRGAVIAVVRLRDLVDRSDLQRTVSHYYWGDYLGLDGDGYYAVRIARGGKVRFDMTSGRRVP